MKVDFKIIFDEIRKKNTHKPNSNEIFGNNFDWSKLFNAFLENSKGLKFEIWGLRECVSGAKNDERRCFEVLVYELKPLYQGGYNLKPVKWVFADEFEAVNKLGKMRLLQQLDKSSDGYHRFSSEICKKFTEKHYNNDYSDNGYQKQTFMEISTFDENLAPF